MTTNDLQFRERVVKLQEFCEGQLLRTFYCIYDRDFRHWMSKEPFGGMLWTKDVSCRREFRSRFEAKAELAGLRYWREEREREAQDPLLADIPWERDAA